jgi:hypothetical protein
MTRTTARILATAQTPFDLDFIPLQFLVEGGVNIVADFAFGQSDADFGKVAVGLRPKLPSNMLQSLLHIQRTLPLFRRP